MSRAAAVTFLVLLAVWVIIARKVDGYWARY